MDGAYISAAVGIISGVAGAAGSSLAIIRVFKASVRNEVEEKDALKSGVANCEAGLMRNTESIDKLSGKVDGIVTSFQASIGGLYDRVNKISLEHESRISCLEGFRNGQKPSK